MLAVYPGTDGLLVRILYNVVEGVGSLDPLTPRQIFARAETHLKNVAYSGRKAGEGGRNRGRR